LSGSGLGRVFIVTKSVGRCDFSEGREPLRLLVPSSVPIELWDSGLAISAQAGEKLLTIATTYHVPLWTVNQLKKCQRPQPADRHPYLFRPEAAEPRLEPGVGRRGGPKIAFESLASSRWPDCLAPRNLEEDGGLSDDLLLASVAHGPPADGA
jgi:hypothetical protein